MSDRIFTAGAAIGDQKTSDGENRVNGIFRLAENREAPVVPAGGLAPDHTRWIVSHRRFFLPVAALGEVFRGKFVAGLRQLHIERKLGFRGELGAIQNPKAFAAWLRPLFRSPWAVYSKRPFGGAEQALRYLGCYTHRVAISHHRLVSLDHGNVTFRWRDSAHNNKPSLMMLTVEEFLRRFLLHLLPPGFVRIRRFGFLAHRRRGTLLPLCFQPLGVIGHSAPATSGSIGSLWLFPICGGSMILIERLTAVQIRLRSPPAPAETL
jgi:hypothetical protein